MVHHLNVQNNGLIEKLVIIIEKKSYDAPVISINNSSSILFVF